MLCTAGVNRIGFGPNGVVVWSRVYLLGGWKRDVGDTMLGSEKQNTTNYSFLNHAKAITVNTYLLKHLCLESKWPQELN